MKSVGQLVALEPVIPVDQHLAAVNADDDAFVAVTVGNSPSRCCFSHRRVAVPAKPYALILRLGVAVPAAIAVYPGLFSLRFAPRAR